MFLELKLTKKYMTQKAKILTIFFPKLSGDELLFVHSDEILWQTLKNFKEYFVRTFTIILQTNKDYCDLIPTIVLDMFVDPCQNDDARKPRFSTTLIRLWGD